MTVPTAPAVGARARVRAGLLLGLCLAALVGGAFAWPPAWGGCTSFAVVPAAAAGPDLGAGDVVVTRCERPSVGDRVVYRATGAVWTVGRVVQVDPAVWWVRSADGAARAVPADAVAVLPWHTSVGALGGLAGTLVVVVVAAVRPRWRHRPVRTWASSQGSGPAWGASR